MPEDNTQITSHTVENKVPEEEPDIAFTTHSFKLQDREELNTFKFVSLHTCALGYFEAQKEVLMKNFTIDMEQKRHLFIHKYAVDEIAKKNPEIHDLSPTEQRDIFNRKITRIATKRADVAIRLEKEALEKTFTEFLAVNDRMLDHMEKLMEVKQMDMVVETIYQFTDHLITEKTN